MILVNERFISADHIEHIYIEPLPTEGHHAVIVQLSGSAAIFGRHDFLTLQMAFELRRRFVRAIVNYKSSDTPEIQHVKMPTYQEVHPESETENSSARHPREKSHHERHTSP